MAAGETASGEPKPPPRVCRPELLSEQVKQETPSNSACDPGLVPVQDFRWSPSNARDLCKLSSPRAGSQGRRAGSSGGGCRLVQEARLLR